MCLLLNCLNNLFLSLFGILQFHLEFNQETEKVVPPQHLTDFHINVAHFKIKHPKLYLVFILLQILYDVPLFAFELLKYLHFLINSVVNNFLMLVLHHYFISNANVT